MNYPLYLARRLSLAGSGKRKAPAVSVAVAAVALSIAVMIASVAIVTGFKSQIIEKVIGFNGHLTVYVADINGQPANELLSLYPELDSIMKENKMITNFNLGISTPGVMKTQEEFKGIYMKGLSGKHSIDFLSRNLIEGKIPDFNDDNSRNKIVISSAAANQLGLNVGDKVDTYFIIDQIKVRRLEIAGIYNSHFNQYDDLLAFGSPELIQKVASLNQEQGTYLEVYVDNFDNIDNYSQILQDSLDDGFLEGKLKSRFYVESVKNQGAGYFNWLSLLDTNVIIVLVLMIIIGCVTLISGMLIIILEKKRFIGMIKALGAPTSKVRQIFIWLALKIAMRGLLIGNLIILSLLFLQYYTHFLRLDPEAYYIDFVPVKITWLAILGLNVGVLIIIYLVLILPSRFVAGISPAETMRYE